MMMISMKQVKRCGPNCHCPACNAEWAEYWAEQREIDELVHRDRLVREYRPASDREWREHLEACGHGEPSEVMYG